MKKFTVLLLYPDYLADNYGDDTYLAHVKARDARSATRKAQREASKINAPNDPKDYGVLVVFDGWHDDLNTRRWITNSSP